jgi:hypothetical protein
MRAKRFGTRWRHLAGALGLALLAPLAGCGPSTGTVTGKVTYQNEPVAAARVNVGPVASDLTGNDGTYKITGVPVGEVEVTVLLPAGSSGFGMPMIPEGGGGVPPGKEGKGSGGFRPGQPNPSAVNIPTDLVEKYRDPKTSGLKLTVKSGENSFPIDVK